MKIQLLSDLHLEFQHYPYSETDADVVVLAGDINIKKRGLSWIEDHIKGKPVIYIMGNHEYYNGAYPKVFRETKELAKNTDIHVLENDRVTLDGITFLGCTLWTNFSLLEDPRIAGYFCQQKMNDYKKIRLWPRYSKLRSIDVALIHKKSMSWLGKELASCDCDKTVVVTHHAPSIQSLPLHRHEEELSAAYASDLDDFILTHQPAYWVHGHIHHSSDYRIGKTRVLSNPKGYPDDPNEDFDPCFLFGVEN